MKRIGLACALALASMSLYGACSSSSTGGSGGANSSGGVRTGGSVSGGANGSAGSGGASARGGSTATGGASARGGSGGGTQPGGTCSNGTACGGDVVGAWTVSSSCIDVSGRLDMGNIGAGCDYAPVTGSLKVSGSWTIKGDGTYTDNTVTSGDERFTLAKECLVISSTQTDCAGAVSLLASVLGFETLKCDPLSDGGCDCSGHINQEGSPGLIVLGPSLNGTYKTGANALTTGDSTEYGYCVSGTKLTLTPKSTNPTVVGSIELQKSGSGGAGGAAGGGGKAGAGGSTGGASGGVGGASSKGGAGGASSTGGTTGSGGSGGSSGSAPCDIYAAGNTPCVAAHSVVRALYSSYRGKLYQVRRSDNTTKDIETSAADGIADTGPEDTFCAGSTCVLTAIYDQSGKGNDLWYQGSTQVPASPQSKPPSATADAVTVAGHKIYSVYISPGNCLWHDASKSGIALAAQPEGMYMVTSARHTNSGCCFDYGNSETTRSADVGGAMDAINISTTTAWGSGAGPGPWIMADMEWGLFAQGDNKKNPNDPTQTAPFVTAVLKNNGTTEYALKGGDATTGSLTTYYKGSVPWNPMKKQGAIILGCGGDCCKPNGGANASSGIFFEGAIVTGYPSDATEDAIQKSIVSVGYGK